MLFCYFCLTFVVAVPFDLILAQNSDGVFSYDKLPDRIPHRKPMAPLPSRRPEVPRSTLPSDRGSKYLRPRKRGSRKPGKKDRDKSILMELMGEDYQKSLMSDEKPERPKISIPLHQVNLDEVPGRWSQERLFEEARDLNLTDEFSSLQPELLPFQDSIRSWLLKRSTCPVEFTWKDLGKDFWPRWVLNGECVDRKGSCSFPTGKHCVPGATTDVHVLRWQCQKMKIVQKSAAESKLPPVEPAKKMRMVRRREATVDDDARRSDDSQSDIGSSADDDSREIRVLERYSSNVTTSDESVKEMRKVHQRRKARARTHPDGTRRSRGRQSDVEPSADDEASGEIRVPERHPSEVKTSDELSKRVGRQYPKSKTGRRPVPTTRPEQKRRKQCDWYRVPVPITIDCFCAC